MRDFLEKYKRAISVASLAIAALGGLFIFLYFNTGSIFCGDVIYTSEYSSCRDLFSKNILAGVVVSLSIAAILAVILLISIQDLRTRFFRYSRFFLPLIFISGALALWEEGQPCGWICIRFFPAILILALFAYLFITLAIVWSIIFTPNHQPRKSSVFALFIVIALLVYGASSLSDWYDNHDREAHSQASSAKNEDLCKVIWNSRSEDRCVRSIAIGKGSFDLCKTVNDKEMRDECVAYIQRNIATSYNDVSLCDKIELPQQKQVCRNLILENLIQ